MQQQEFNSWDQVSAQNNKFHSFYLQHWRHAATSSNRRECLLLKPLCGASQVRAARNSIIGLLTITLSGGFKQWTRSKHRAAAGAQQNSLQEGGPRGELLTAGFLIDTGVRLAPGEQGQCHHSGTRKLRLREQSFILYWFLDTVLDPFQDRMTVFSSVLAGETPGCSPAAFRSCYL